MFKKIKEFFKSIFKSKRQSVEVEAVDSPQEGEITEVIEESERVCEECLLTSEDVAEINETQESIQVEEPVEFLTVEQYSKKYNVSRSTILRWVKADKIEYSFNDKDQIVITDKRIPVKDAKTRKYYFIEA